MTNEREAALRAWRLGEERLYPVVMVRPETYAALLEPVRALADHLASVPDTDALVTNWRMGDARSDLVAAGIDLPALPPEGDPDMIRDAAYQLRARELHGREAAERAERAIEHARAGHQATVELWGVGEHEMLPGYRHVEMSLATGAAVWSETLMDAESGEPLFTIQAVRLAVDTGEGLDEAPLAEQRTFRSPDDWREALTALRAQILDS